MIATEPLRGRKMTFSDSGDDNAQVVQVKRLLTSWTLHIDPASLQIAKLVLPLKRNESIK